MNEIMVRKVFLCWCSEELLISSRVKVSIVSIVEVMVRVCYLGIGIIGLVKLNLVLWLVL